MRDNVPECLNRRYRAIDQLITDLNTVISDRDSSSGCICGDDADDPSIKLMCEFWTILKENPDCNLSQEVKQRMGLLSKHQTSLHPQQIACFMASDSEKNSKDARKRDAAGKAKNACCNKGPEKEKSSKCCSSKSLSSTTTSDVLPLSKVLCNLKDAASFDKKCNRRLNDLLSTEKRLQDQITHLEHREKDGVQLLKQADCMWSCMEDTYKKKLAESLERQKNLLKELKEIEKSNGKWRKNKKDLEDQMSNVNKCYQEITDKIRQKGNDIKCIDLEIVDFKKRIETNKIDTDLAKKSLNSKKAASDRKLVSIAEEIAKMEKKVAEERTCKTNKEAKGDKYIKEAREDLQKICKVLLQKRLENEDLKAEKDALILEINMLKDTSDKCKEKCKNKQQTIADDIKKVNEQIGDFKVQCIKCHQCTDTIDVRKFCTDCPRCVAERDCLVENYHCSPDHGLDCICMSVKEKFLNNVFENMYTVLERQIKCSPGKCVADAVLYCLRKSKNGKLNGETRRILQEFILSTVKKNLNLTIIGGAVKTRCELDPDSYKQLMLCLNKVQVSKPDKTDKGTVAKKAACERWGGTNECNCPKGPKACICTKKAPPPNSKNPPANLPVDEEDQDEIKTCPHKDDTKCGPECGMRAASCVDTDVTKWAPSPCQGKTCTFSKNMRAAQCVLGPEKLTSDSRRSYFSEFDDDLVPCTCGSSSIRPCTCRKDLIKAVANSKKYVKDIILPKISHIENEIRKKSFTVLEQPNVVKKIQSSNLEFDTKRNGNILNDLCKELSLIKINDSKSFGEVDNDAVPVLVQNPSFNVNCIKTEITSTPSGTLAMEVDESLIELIKNKTKENPNNFVWLEKQNSGNFVITFDSKESSSTKRQRIVLKQSSSGETYIELKRAFIKPESIGGPNKELSTEYEPENEKFVCSEVINHNKVLDDKNSEHSDNVISELTNLYKNVIYKNIEFKVLIDGNTSYKVKAILTKTLSGNFALNLMDVSKVNVAFKTNEQPVTIQRSSSNHYVVDTTDSTHPNAVLRKTPSGEFLVVFKNTVFQTQPKNVVDTNDLSLHRVPQFYKVKIKGDTKSNDLSDLPLLSRLTPSDNYIFVLDTEYDRYYKKIINEYVGDDGVCLIGLIKTSDSIIIDLSESGDESYKRALLIKTSSGNIKIVTNNNNNMIQFQKHTPSLESNSLVNLANRLPVSQKESIESVPRIKNIVKYSSDTNLYSKKSRSASQQKSLLCDSSNELKITPSGNYTLVLDKEIKKVFLENLKKYISKNSQTLVPITKTDSGEISIALTKDSDLMFQGSLKIKPSGSIYVSVDESYLNAMIHGKKKYSDDLKSEVLGKSKDECIFEKKYQLPKIDSRSYHIIKKVVRPEDKSVSTTCNARPESCACDNKQCVCKELQQDEYNWMCSYPERESLRIFKPNKTNKLNINQRIVDEYKNNVRNEARYKEHCFFTIDSNQGDRGFQKRFSDTPKKIKKNVKIKKDNLRTNKNAINKNMSDTVDLEICNPNLHSNTLNYLPLQMPAFLMDFSLK